MTLPQDCASLLLPLVCWGADWPMAPNQRPFDDVATDMALSSATVEVAFWLLLAQRDCM